MVASYTVTCTVHVYSVEFSFLIVQQLNYTRTIKLDRDHPYPTARKALNSAMGTTIGLALIGGFCCTFLSCFGVLFAKKVSLPIRI